MKKRELKFRARSLEASPISVSPEFEKVVVGQWLYFSMGYDPVESQIGNVFWSDDKDGKSWFHIHGYMCDFDTLSQFTNFKDSDGSDIYEGDILTTVLSLEVDSVVPVVGVVVFDDEFSGQWSIKVYTYESDSGKYHPSGLLPLYGWQKHTRVIGDIHESPIEQLEQ